MHPPCFAEEDTSFARDGRSAVEEMFERREPGSARMAALERLRKLHLVADQDHVLRAHAHCDLLASDTCPASSMNK